MKVWIVYSLADDIFQWALTERGMQEKVYNICNGCCEEGAYCESMETELLWERVSIFEAFNIWRRYI